jgi:all-trans-retinol 13,14-reductase
MLSKNGYRVSVLEKNAQLGGCLQTFARGGVKFETGMHYIGSMEEGQNLHTFFKYLSLLPDVKLHSLDKMAYDIISIAGKRFAFANGRENFVELLAQHFPAERQSLQSYCSTIENVANDSPLYSLRYSDSLTILNPDYIKQSASGFIDSVTSNPLLRQVLAGNLPLYAGIKDKTPLYIHALIRNFYGRSACRIVGGSDAIATSLVRSIRAMGGLVMTSAQVAKINCDEAKAKSVTLKNGEEIAGDYFISNVHPLRMVEMLNTRLIRRSYRDRILGLKNTVSNFTVYIRFKKNTVPYLNTNFYHYSCNDVWECENYTQADWPKGYLYMHLCSSANQQYADGAILIAYMTFNEVLSWKGTRMGNRGEEYEEFKRQKAERLLNELEKQMPGTQKNVEQYYTSTPLTYLDYIGTEGGSMYGVLRDCTDPMQTVISQRTKIPNLFQTGQNINSHGILGVIIGAIITSSEFLGMGAIMEQIQKAKS